MRHATVYFLAFVVVLAAASVSAQESKPINIALVTPIQIFNETTPISGARLNILYGKNESVRGLDIGLVNHNGGGESMGLQWGLVGIVEGDFVGWQDNGVNIVKGKAEGLQWGLVNSAGYASGLQLGFVNYARSMKGIQIGLVNIIKQGGQFPVFPIVNWSL